MNQQYKIPNEIWQQIKSITSKELKKALDNDEDWELVNVDGSAHHYYNSKKCLSCQDIAIHVHPKKGGYGSRLLKGLLGSIK